MKRNNKILLGILGVSMLVYTCKVSRQLVQRDANGNIIVDTNPSPAYLTPEESLKSIHLPKGYSLELVASEPMIHEPVAITWDGNGRMYVAEMNTYMQNADGTGQMEPISAVKRLEDTNGDGKMDKSTVFIDKLVLPRMILALDDRILVNETNSNNIYSYRDTDGDGVADEKKLVFKNDEISRSNLEHQKSGLIWNLDNKIYVTVENKRYLYEDGMLQADTLRENPGGQWGLTSDNYGRLFFCTAGSETPALNFQQNPYYGQLNLKDQFNEEFQAVWPIISTPDVQGGPYRLRPDSTLNHFTACTGQSIFRGNALPADAQGDLFICEPVGRLVRRAKVTNTNGKISLKNAYNKEEFLASTDMNFRPVNSVTGPDGALYIVDMHRGIIQEGNWTRKGSYLRKQIDEKKFDQNIGRGRIYRVVYDGIKPDKTKPKLLDLSAGQLVPYLAHPNGWWRDNAQKLLVLRGDQSVAPALKAMAANKTGGQLSRIHALWTLNGLKALDKATFNLALNDADAEIRKTALWIAEDLMQKDPQLINTIVSLKDDPNPEVRFQLSLTLRFYESSMAKDVIRYMLAKYQDELMAESQKTFENNNEKRILAAKNAAAMAEEDKKLVLKGATIFKQLCAICHGADGKGVTIGGKDMPAPPLAGVKDVNGNPEKLIKILLHGLTGPIDGKTYPDAMPALGSNDDEYIAAVLSYIRNDLGNKASVVRPEDVKKVRDQHKGRDKYWTVDELQQSTPGRR